MQPAVLAAKKKAGTDKSYGSSSSGKGISNPTEAVLLSVPGVMNGNNAGSAASEPVVHDQASIAENKELLRLGSFGFSADELRVYSILIEMEKKLGWDNLIQLRSNVFIFTDEAAID